MAGAPVSAGAPLPAALAAGWEMPWPPGFARQGELPRRSPTRTVVTHTLVGAAAGVLFASLWRYATPPGQRSEALTTWAVIGAATGALSGLLTVVLTRDERALAP